MREELITYQLSDLEGYSKRNEFYSDLKNFKKMIFKTWWTE